MEKIQGKTKTVRELLSGAKYGIDYYQRGYKWEEKQITELLNDLTDRFLTDYREEHHRSEVIKYGHYFLGSIIITELYLNRCTEVLFKALLCKAYTRCHATHRVHVNRYIS